LIEHGLIMYVSRIFIPCYMTIFPSGPGQVKPACLVLHQGNLNWTFVVFSDWFTGLQYRLQGYLYLVACIVFASEPTPVPEGGFRRFVIRFCGSTYNATGHLNIPPVLLLNIRPSTITGKLFIGMIGWNRVPIPDFFLKFPILDPWSDTCANQANACGTCGILQRFFVSADGLKIHLRRKLSDPGKTCLDPAASRAWRTLTDGIPPNRWPHLREEAAEKRGPPDTGERSDPDDTKTAAVPSPSARRRRAVFGTSILIPGSSHAVWQCEWPSE
jgi:hypothetical protein